MNTDNSSNLASRTGEAKPPATASSRPGSRLALGTAQFGMDYGIANATGQIDDPEAELILSVCRAGELMMLDTAPGYGRTERFLGRSDVSDFEVVTKLDPSRAANVEGAFQASLRRLGLSSIYGYLVHDIGAYRRDPGVWRELRRLRDSGWVKKIGFSLYSPEELEVLWGDGISLDLVQVPYSVLDRRFESMFTELASRGVEVHVRSVFLQGLLFLDRDRLSAHFESVRGVLEAVDVAAAGDDQTKVEICLGFVLGNDHVDRIVVGVDSSRQLIANLDALQRFNEGHLEVPDTVSALQVSDAKILNPSLWKL